MRSMWRLAPGQLAVRVKWIAIVGALLFVVGPAWLLLMASVMTIGSWGGLIFLVPLIAIPASFYFYGTGCVRMKRAIRRRAGI